VCRWGEWALGYDLESGTPSIQLSSIIGTRGGDRAEGLSYQCFMHVGFNFFALHRGARRLNCFGGLLGNTAFCLAQKVWRKDG